MEVKNYWLLACLAVGLFSVSCSDNDDPEPEPDPEPSYEAEIITVTNGNYTSYSDWTYINLNTGETETHPDATEWIYTDGSTREAQTPVTINIDWHIAIHRYEMKTNGGQAYDTQLKSMDAVTSLPENVTWTADETVSWEGQQSEDEPLEVLTDMSNMMAGSVGYSRNPELNKVLCSWTTRTPTGGMPPTLYTPSQNVLVVKFDDGSWVKLLFTAAGNTETSSSGYISWQYAFYPAGN